MKLAFNAINSGLGNNGGSRTIILSCAILESLGHRCDIVARTDNFSWFSHKSIINSFPKDLDAVINVAAVDYNITRSLSIPTRVAWWRGHESWSNSESYLCNCYRDRKVINLVNSNGLKDLLKSYGADSYVVYQGVDLDEYSKEVFFSRDNKLTIGCLYDKKITKRWVDFEKLAEILGTDYNYIGMGKDQRNDTFLTEYYHQPSLEDKLKMYEKCDIWFAPTELEGLHNVPIEAALRGCLIVSNDCPTNGMVRDYAFNHKTAMVYKARDIEEAADMMRHPQWHLVEYMYEYIVRNIGTREDNMKKLTNYLEDCGD